jgi:probable HAF family extracellular repeat protein
LIGGGKCVSKFLFIMKLKLFGNCMDEIIITLRQRLDLPLLWRFATRSSYVDQRISLIREILGLSWLRSFLVAPMLLLCAGLALTPEHAEAAGGTYTATEVATLPVGSTRIVRAVNDSGEIVGTVKGDHGIRAFFLHGGVLQEIAELPTGSDYSAAFGINNLGQVVGSMNASTGETHAFRSERATGIVDLKTLPGDNSSAALAINTSGKAAGWSSGPTGVRAVTWSSEGAAIQALPMLPESDSCRGLAINDNNEVAGVCNIASVPHAVLWAGGTGTAQDLGTLPGGFESAVLSINNKGDIVGSSGDNEGEHHAALWPAGGAIQNLGVLPNRISSQALAINNRNEVVGVSSESGDGGGEHAFLWTERDGIQDLNELTSNSDFVLTHAIAISAQGVILATGHDKITHSADKSHEGHDLPLRIFLLSGPVGGP